LILVIGGGVGVVSVGVELILEGVLVHAGVSLLLLLLLLLLFSPKIVLLTAVANDVIRFE